MTLIVLMFISGCQFSGQQTIKTSGDYKKGYDGLEFKFIENQYIKEIYEITPFSFKLLLENKGAHNIENGIILMGFEDQNFRFIHSDFTNFRLEGKSIYYPKGNQKLNSYQLETKKIDEKESIERKTHLYLTSCYDYSTDFSENICIDSDIYNLKKDKSCSPNEISLQGGQGGPIAVTKIETRMLFKSQEDTVQPQFTLHLKNKGQGIVINKDNIYTICSSQSIEKEELNEISLEAELFGFDGNIQLDCKPENPIRMKDEIATVICTSPTRVGIDMGTYPSPLHINIEYGYMSTISKDITIKRAST